jgi:hypothetical protein
LIDNDFGLLQWKENNRAVASFKSMNDIEINKEQIQSIVKQWLIK